MVSSDTTGDERYQNFYSVLKKKLEVYKDSKRHLDRFLSTDFNVFTLFNPNENLLSEIIADLLNPSGSHGQRHRFLDTFLRQVIKETNLLDSLLEKQPRSVTCESHTVYIENSQRRIDILVDFENFGLGIENKPEADDQEQQLKDYSDDLKKRYKGKFCLLYLTWKGDNPKEKSIACNLREELKRDRKLICISYRRDILKWIEECCRLCESDRFRWFLRDFVDYINGGQTMSSSSVRESILEHALENKENLATTLDIVFAFDPLCERIISDFLLKLETFVLNKLGQDSDGWDVNNDKSLLDCPLGKDNHLSFGRVSWKKQYFVGVQPLKSDACDVIVGVWYDKGTKTNVPRRDLSRLREKLNLSLGVGKQKEIGEEWAWCRYLDAPYRNWNTKETLIELREDRAVEYLGTYLVKIMKKAAPIINEHVRGSSMKKTTTTR